jgi:multidrug efflux system outer membrane protein
MKTAALSLWLATSALASVALAQAPSAAPAAPSPAPSATTAAPDQPALPNVEDPMLDPVPPPAHTLTSWREALSLLRSRNTQLRAQIAQVDVARARSREALAYALPTLGTALGSTFIRSELLRNTVHVTNYGVTPAGTVTATAGTADVPNPATTWGAGAVLNVPIFAPKAWYDKRTADQVIEVEQLSTLEAQRQVVGAVADSIVTTVTAERLADVTRESLRAALSTLDLTKRRATLGASSALDVLRAEGEVQTARGQLVTADETLRRARESLGLALGYAEGWGVQSDIRLDELAADARASCRTQSDVSQRADVRAQSANLHVSERAKGSVDWAYWPTANAYTQFLYSNVPFANALHFSWTVGAQLNWTIYDGGLRGGQRQEALANERIAKEQLTDTQRKAQLDVVQSFRGVTVAEQNLGVSTRARDVASETARLARVAFINGSGTSFDLVDTASKLRQAELDLTVKQFEVLRARVAALLALANCDV